MAKNLRVPIPSKADELMGLARKVYEKHQALGTSSPLHTMEDYNWTAVAPDLLAAEAAHKEAAELDKKAEELRQKRNLLLKGSIKGAVTSSRNVLLGAYAKNPKKAGAFGFTVDDSPKAVKPAKA